MKFGYVRVSSKDQNLARQIEQLKKVPVEKIFSEKESGKNINNRFELLNLLNCIKKNDIVYVTSLDRLGRNADDLTEIIQYIKKKRSVITEFGFTRFFKCARCKFKKHADRHFSNSL